MQSVAVSQLLQPPIFSSRDVHLSEHLTLLSRHAPEPTCLVNPHSKLVTDEVRNYIYFNAIEIYTLSINHYSSQTTPTPLSHPSPLPHITSLILQLFCRIDKLWVHLVNGLEQSLYAGVSVNRSATLVVRHHAINKDINTIIQSRLEGGLFSNVSTVLKMLHRSTHIIVYYIPF